MTLVPQPPQEGELTSDRRKPTDLDRKMAETMGAWYKLQEDHDRLAARLHTAEEQNRLLMSENEGQRRRIAELDHRLTYFIRHSTEVATRMIEVKKVIDLAGQTIDHTLIEAQRAGYRPPPNGTPREASQPDDGEPIPQFLQDHNERQH
jgi:hypothetical protein